ncbi:MAG TPA: hypothetical protein VEB86_02055, partial [Chryseosolibacter sp.]|nr:hypothetical protein [Chryseosolibacter sp.]
LATTLAATYPGSFIPVTDWKTSLAESDICITATPAKNPFLRKEHIQPGTFIAAVGSDSEEKNELDPALLAGSYVIADRCEQAAAIGELHHAIRSGLMAANNIYGELGEIVAGKKAAPQLNGRVTIFDSTGLGLQDVAAAATVYENAIDRKTGLVFDFQQ